MRRRELTRGVYTGHKHVRWAKRRWVTMKSRTKGGSDKGAGREGMERTTEDEG